MGVALQFRRDKGGRRAWELPSGIGERREAGELGRVSSSLGKVREAGGLGWGPPALREGAGGYWVIFSGKKWGKSSVGSRLMMPPTSR